MNIIARGIPMEAQEVVEKGVEIYADIETALHRAAKALWKLHELHDDAYLSGLISGTEAMNGRARTLEIMGSIGDAQADVLSGHVFAAGKAQEQGVDIDTPYAPLPPRQTKSGGGR